MPPNAAIEWRIATPGFDLRDTAHGSINLVD
jgi:hypothetical protein